LPLNWTRLFPWVAPKPEPRIEKAEYPWRVGLGVAPVITGLARTYDLNFQSFLAGVSPLAGTQTLSAAAISKPGVSVEILTRCRLPLFFGIAPKTR
jgi:hypothetical protein